MQGEISCEQACRERSIHLIFLGADMPYGRRCCRALIWLAGETLRMQGEGEEPATGGRSVLVLEMLRHVDTT